MKSREPLVQFVPSDVERLTRISLLAPATMPEHGDGEWLSNWIALLLAKLPPDLDSRNAMMCTLYEDYTLGTPAERRDEFRRLCRTYESGPWRKDSGRITAPHDYLGTRKELLFQIFNLSGGPPPLSDKRLILILSSDCFYKRNGRRKMRFSCPN
ncbi:hypothetical protein [Rhizobium sp.]|jgi:hypothetical protein|uniref:hypothetical protein n=1 Tax=Rhizobium sp. TaxID=391 RepID=UPI002AA89D2F